MSKLQKLAGIEGYEDILTMLEKATFDSISPGICTNPGCDYTTNVEPDQGEGFCENCRTNSVKSCLVLADMI